MSRRVAPCRAVSRRVAPFHGCGAAWGAPVLSPEESARPAPPASFHFASGCRYVAVAAALLGWPAGRLVCYPLKVIYPAITDSQPIFDHSLRTLDPRIATISCARRARPSSSGDTCRRWCESAFARARGARKCCGGQRSGGRAPLAVARVLPECDLPECDLPECDLPECVRRALTQAAPLCAGSPRGSRPLDARWVNLAHRSHAMFIVPLVLLWLLHCYWCGPRARAAACRRGATSGTAQCANGRPCGRSLARQPGLHLVSQVHAAPQESFAPCPPREG